MKGHPPQGQRIGVRAHRVHGRVASMKGRPRRGGEERGQLHAALRVADASIMPNIVGVNTQAAATMIGWHGGGLL